MVTNMASNIECLSFIIDSCQKNLSSIIKKIDTMTECNLDKMIARLLNKLLQVCLHLNKKMSFFFFHVCPIFDCLYLSASQSRQFVCMSKMFPQGFFVYTNIQHGCKVSMLIL